MIGNMLRERDVQYTALKDDITNTWRILDTWHDELKNLGPDDEIADGNAAVTILTEGAFSSLIREAARLGVLDNVSFSGGGDEYDSSEEIKEMQDKIVKYEKDIIKLQASSNESESFKIKEKALGAMLKLAAMSDVALLRED
jgi:hypothetical protein